MKARVVGKVKESKMRKVMLIMEIEGQLGKMCLKEAHPAELAYAEAMVIKVNILAWAYTLNENDESIVNVSFDLQITIFTF